MWYTIVGKDCSASFETLLANPQGRIAAPATNVEAEAETATPVAVDVGYSGAALGGDKERGGCKVPAAARPREQCHELPPRQQLLARRHPRQQLVCHTDGRLEEARGLQLPCTRRAHEPRRTKPRQLRALVVEGKAAMEGCRARRARAIAGVRRTAAQDSLVRKRHRLLKLDKSCPEPPPVASRQRDGHRLGGWPQRTKLLKYCLSAAPPRLCSQQ